MILGRKISEALSKGTRTRDSNGGLTLITLLGKFFKNWNSGEKTVSRMDEPNPRPEDLYKRPEELFHHSKPAPNYGESPSLPNKKRFQSNLGKHRGKKPLQVGTDEIGLMAKSIL